MGLSRSRALLILSAGALSTAALAVGAKPLLRPRQLRDAVMPQLQSVIKSLGETEEVAAGSARTLRLIRPLSDSIALGSNYLWGRLSLPGSEVLRLARSTQIRFGEATGSTARDLVMSGEVFLTYDGRGKPLPAAPSVIMVSLAGINLAYLQRGTVGVGEFQIPILNDAQSWFRSGVDIAAEGRRYRAAMVRKWRQVLAEMSRRGVTAPVLCALGQGAFLGGAPSFKSACHRWAAEALSLALQEEAYGFAKVIVAIPPADERILQGFRAHAGALFQVEAGSLFEIAHRLARELKKSGRVGILNPSDQEALVSGNIGQYWHRGHVALEELFPFQTTALLNNWKFTGEEPANYRDLMAEIAPSAD